jgi:DNA-binding MarR family transcriptional regulator
MTEMSETRKRKGFAMVPLRQGRESGRKCAGTETSESQEEFSVSLLFRTSIRLQKTLDRCFLRFGMTAQEAAVLIRCVEAGAISARRLADAMNRDKGKITRFVDRLEAGNFISRKSDPRDHRSMVIKATNRGRRVASRLKVTFEQVRNQFFAGVLTRDIDQLGSILAQVYANADFLRQDWAAEDRRADTVRSNRALPTPEGEERQ